MSELHSLSALRQAADYLRTEERHWWADTIMAAIEALASEDRAAEAIERVRALHVRRDEWCGYHESTLCEDAHAYCYECRADYPCPTIRALDGVGTEYRQEAVLPDQLARIDTILARSDQACEIDDSDPLISCGWKRDIRDIREVRGL